LFKTRKVLSVIRARSEFCYKYGISRAHKYRPVTIVRDAYASSMRDLSYFLSSKLLTMRVREYVAMSIYMVRLEGIAADEL